MTCSPPPLSSPLSSPLPIIGLLLLGACTGKDTDDTAVGLGPPVSVTDGLPPLTSPLDLVIFEQILQSVDPMTGEVADSQPPVFVGLSFAQAEALPLMMSSDIEGCWAFDMDRPATDEHLDPTLHMEVGATSIDLQDRGKGIYMATPFGTAAQAASAPGATLSLEGSSTGVTVPEALAIDELPAAWSGMAEDGHIRLSWRPAPTPHDLSFVQVVLDADGRNETWCVLADDGAADIDLGAPVPSPIILRLARVEAAVFDHPTLGAVMVTAEQDIELDRP